MNNSVQSTIENIKIQEKDKEEKLKEKREAESAMGVLNRTIRDTKTMVDKLSREIEKQTACVDNFRLERDKEMIRQNALSAQLDECSKELDRLRAETDQRVSNVWKLRSSMCTAVQNTVNEWDIQALLTKRVTSGSFTKAIKKPQTNELNNEIELKNAKENLEDAIKERDRLLKEPENGEEFLRIKNALQYSEEQVVHLKAKLIP